MKTRSAHRSLRTRRGFTLVEVITATFIALIGLAGAMSIGIWQLKATQFNQRSSEATAAGQEKLEELNQAQYSNISNGQETNGDFNLRWTVTTSNRCKLVSLRVEWQTANDTQFVMLRDLFPDDHTTGYIITN